MKEAFDKALDYSWNQTLKLLGFLALIGSINQAQSFISWAWIFALVNFIVLLIMCFIEFKKESNITSKNSQE